jgi:hypothetical protein
MAKARKKKRLQEEQPPAQRFDTSFNDWIRKDDSSLSLPRESRPAPPQRDPQGVSLHVVLPFRHYSPSTLARMVVPQSFALAALWDSFGLVWWCGVMGSIPILFK